VTDHHSRIALFQHAKGKPAADEVWPDFDGMCDSECREQRVKQT
jgi:hypothetical protein